MIWFSKLRRQKCFFKLVYGSRPLWISYYCPKNSLTILCWYSLLFFRPICTSYYNPATMSKKHLDHLQLVWVVSHQRNKMVLSSWFVLVDQFEPATTNQLQCPKNSLTVLNWFNLGFFWVFFFVQQRNQKRHQIQPCAIKLPNVCAGPSSEASCVPFCTPDEDRMLIWGVGFCPLERMRRLSCPPPYSELMAMLSWVTKGIGLKWSLISVQIACS